MATRRTPAASRPPRRAKVARKRTPGRPAGDMTQIDLPKHQKSGLKDALEVLRNVNGISFTFFESRDVVRHPLVARIVNAYDARDTADAQTGPA